MPTLNISLPDSMRVYIEEQTATGGYSTASEFVRTLIREDQKRKTKERIDTLLLDGLASGEAKMLTQRDWEDVRRQVRGRTRKRAKSGR